MTSTSAYSTDHRPAVGDTLDCGDVLTATDGIGTGYAETPDGRFICYRHAEESERAAFLTADTFTGYLSGADGHALHVTTWTGAHLARVVQHSVSRNGWHGSDVHAWRAVDPSGAYWYGRNGGIGMATTMRRAKHNA